MRASRSSPGPARATCRRWCQPSAWAGERASSPSSCCGGIGCPRACGRNFSESKIENLGVATLGDEKIRGLDVAMDNAFGMSSIERVGNFDGEAAAFRLNRLAGDAVLQGQPSRNSMAMNAWPCSQQSWMVQMLG